MNNNKQQGDTTMNESYKDKFNATMKKFGIDSLGDLKSDEEKKKFFKAVDKSHDAVNESVTDELLSIAHRFDLITIEIYIYARAARRTSSGQSRNCIYTQTKIIIIYKLITQN